MPDLDELGELVEASLTELLDAARARNGDGKPVAATASKPARAARKPAAKATNSSTSAKKPAAKGKRAATPRAKRPGSVA